MLRKRQVLRQIKTMVYVKGWGKKFETSLVSKIFLCAEMAYYYSKAAFFKNGKGESQRTRAYQETKKGECYMDLPTFQY